MGEREVQLLRIVIRRLDRRIQRDYEKSLTLRFLKWNGITRKLQG